MKAVSAYVIFKCSLVAFNIIRLLFRLNLFVYVHSFLCTSVRGCGNLPMFDDIEKVCSKVGFYDR